MSDHSCLTQFVQQCHTTLLDSKEDEVRCAKKYLNQVRKITDSSIICHRIGYCIASEKIPTDIQFYGKKNQDIDTDDSGYAYFIRGRVIVPVYAEFGELVGFATRKPAIEPGNTWWNLSSPFKKGNHLFLLDKTRKNIYKKNKIYLVEGYSDAIILYQAGIGTVCGLMGTHLSPRKIGLIARYCNDICLCLDMDENKSGQKAQEKAIASLKEFGFSKSISIIDGLPVGEDPDVYIIKHGIDKFLSLERKLKASEIKSIYKRSFCN